MTKKTVLIFSIILIIGAFWSYRYSYDNRYASNLSAYCQIDFRGIANPLTQHIDNATLSICVFRFSSQPLEKFCIINIDDKKYKITATESLTAPPTYAIQDWKNDKCFKYSNVLSLCLSQSILEKIMTAKTIKVSLQYTGNHSPIELPLSTPDLQYWKNQL